MNDLDRNIRKCRKKLRQIDQLSVLTRSLNDEENKKVAQLSDIRSQLHALLLEKASAWSGDQDLSAVSDTDEQPHAIEPHGLLEESCLAQPDASSSTAPKRKPCDPPLEASVVQPDLKKAKPQPMDEQRKPQEQPVPRERDPEPEAKKQKQRSQTSEAAKPQLSRGRSHPRYFVQELVGHSDIILDVSIADGLVASASRDTQVKVWALETGSQECSLSGHSDAAQACLVLPSAAAANLTELHLPASSRLVVTGGGDSTLLLWRLDPGLRSGSELRRIYMFTPITCLVRMPDEGLVVALGTSSGKIEVWNVIEKRLERSQSLHSASMTSLRLLPGPGLLLSCSENGELALLRAADLATVFFSGEDGHRRHVRHSAAIALSHEWLVVADAGATLKLCRRGHKAIARVPNSRHEFGLCDALWADKGLVAATAFNLDTGRGYLNFHNFGNPSSPSYLFSLEPPQFSGRFLSLDAVPDPTGGNPKLLVTGGMELLLWLSVQPGDQYSSVECSQARSLRLFLPLAGEDSADGSGLSSDEASAFEEDFDEDGGPVQTTRWWCRLL